MQNAAVSTDHTPVPPPSGPTLRGAARTLEAAQQRIAAAGGIHIGDLVSWNGTGIDVEREEVRRAFATVGLEGLVAHIAPAAALTRAVSETRRPAHLRVTAFLAKNSDTPVAYGVYQLKGNGEGGDAHLCGARVRVDMKLDTVIATPPEGGVVIDECMVLAEQIAAKANRIVTHAETRDVGASMVAAVKRLSGVGLRDKGGFYLLPPASCATWRTLKPELEKLGVQPPVVDDGDD